MLASRYALQLGCGAGPASLVEQTTEPVTYTALPPSFQRPYGHAAYWPVLSWKISVELVLLSPFGSGTPALQPTVLVSCIQKEHGWPLHLPVQLERPTAPLLLG